MVTLTGGQDHLAFPFPDPGAVIKLSKPRPREGPWCSRPCQLRGVQTQGRGWLLFGLQTLWSPHSTWKGVQGAVCPGEEGLGAPVRGAEGREEADWAPTQRRRWGS